MKRVPESLAVPPSARSYLRRARRAAEHLAVRLTTGAGTVVAARDAGNRVALTFDDGPDPVWTPRLLEVLEAHGAKATFFVVGEAAERHPEILRRMVDGGHALGNHTWDHPSLPQLSKPERAEQLRRCAETLADFGGDSSLLRPPYGHQTPASLRHARSLGYTIVMGEVVAEDWRDDSADVLFQRMRQRLEPGSIVLLHDRLATFPRGKDHYQDRQPTIDAVARLLDEFSSSVRFVTVPELLRRSRPRFGYRLLAPDLDHLEVLQKAPLA